MKSVGEILRDKRIELGQSIEDVHKQTKIQKEYLVAIENGNLNQISNNTTVKGFIRNYALFLGLPVDTVLAVFRRDYTESPVGAILPKSVLHPSTETRQWWTPKLTFFAIGIFAILTVVGYFANQYYWLTVGPQLTLSSPTDNQIVTGKIALIGKTSPDSVVKVQGMFIAINPKGEFNEAMVLPRGDNILTVESTDGRGKSRVVKVRVRVE